MDISSAEKFADSQNCSESTSQDIDNTQKWKFSTFSFKIQIGEFCAVNRTLDGLVLQPNIFDFNAVDPIELVSTFDSTDERPASVISCPCLPDTRNSIKREAGRVVYVYKTFHRMHVSATGDHQAYLDSFSKKSLATLRRKINKVDKSNTDKSSIRVFKNAEDVSEFIEVAKSISKVSYQEVLLGTVFRTDPAWRKELEGMANENRFRGYVLYIEDTAVAYNYCPIYGNGVMLYDLSGYKPDYQKYSPGTVLQYHVIAEAFAEPTVRYYDLCQGEGRHKEQFATDSIQCCYAYIFPFNLSNLALIGTHWALETTSDRLVSLLDRMGIKDRIKTFIRRR